MTRRAISRRALLGSGGALVAVGAVAVVGQRTGALGSALRATSLDPVHRPAVADEAVLKAARIGQSRLLAQTRAVASAHADARGALAPVARRLSAQLAHLGGPVDGSAAGTLPSGQDAALKTLSSAYTKAGTTRADDAAHAVSGELAQVLASIAVSLAQDVVVVEALREGLS